MCTLVVLSLSWFSMLKMPVIPFLYKNTEKHAAFDTGVPTARSCPSVTVVWFKQTEFWVCMDRSWHVTKVPL